MTELDDTVHEDKELVARADPSFSLAEKKLAGSAQCLNCGTGLKGPFCYFCGQPDRNFMRFFPTLLRDLMEDVLDLDSRFMRTLKPLFLKPGRLTRDYMEGRRFRYAPPMRLYIFSSIVLFLLAALLSSNAINVGSRVKAGDEGIIRITTATDEEKQQVEEALSNLPAGLREQIDVDKIVAEGVIEKPEKDPFVINQISFNDKPWDRETNPVDIKWFPDWLNEFINKEVEESPKKAEEINSNPNLIVDKVFDILPITMFILLPFVALIFKFWYLFAKRYYVEHLIFSLHNHAFIFICLTMVLLLGLAHEWFISADIERGKQVTEWVAIAIGVWIPLYLLISLRHVYQQGWFLTLGKFVVIGISYVVLLGLVTSVVAISSFVML